MHLLQYNTNDRVFFTITTQKNNIQYNLSVHIYTQKQIKTSACTSPVSTFWNLNQYLLSEQLERDPKHYCDGTVRSWSIGCACMRP